VADIRELGSVYPLKPVQSGGSREQRRPAPKRAPDEPRPQSDAGQGTAAGEPERPEHSIDEYV
jgi:hypothetical protein